MAQIDADLLERYQIELKENPRSRVFAPLAEAYRKMGLIDQALEICKQGVKYHPQFASGRVAYGRVLAEKKDWSGAEEHLRLGTELSPDNLLAHRLLGRCYAELKQSKKALKCFKYVLLLYPKDEEAQRFVQRWESMLAADYEGVLFDEDAEIFQDTEPAELRKVLSVADAFLVRREWAQADKWLKGSNLWKDHPQVIKRLELLSRQRPSSGSLSRRVEKKVHYLRQLLQRIETSSARGDFGHLES